MIHNKTVDGESPMMTSILLTSVAATPSHLRYAYYSNILLPTL